MIRIDECMEVFAKSSRLGLNNLKMAAYRFIMANSKDEIQSHFNNSIWTEICSQSINNCVEESMRLEEQEASNQKVHPPVVLID